jgi:hypothetical protein
VIFWANGDSVTRLFERREQRNKKSRLYRQPPQIFVRPAGAEGALCGKTLVLCDYSMIIGFGGML